MTIELQFATQEKISTVFSGDDEKQQLLGLAKTHGTPLFVIRENKLIKQYQAIKKALPNVTMHYAIKALADKNVLKSLNSQGCSFDIATNGEIELLKECDIKANKCIHTHPIKKHEDIQGALDYGCNIFVVDNMIELEKFSAYKDVAEIIIRIKFSNHSAVVDLGKKFGCEIHDLELMIEKANELGIKVVGLSFHIGSQTVFPTAHGEAVKHSIQLLKKFNQVDWKILDIGGGFPIEYDSSVLDIYSYCEPVREALKLVPKNIRVIAEPGRYLVGPIAQHVISIVGKSKRDDKVWYYADDGLYGAFSGQLFDHAKYPLTVLNDNYDNDVHYPSVVAGPTCDSIDVIDEEIMLPDLQVGDLLLAEQIGAYSVASSTEFNLCKRPKTVFIEK
ncbi:MAG: type III PLP-dependent enzyme [Gammaproteobacteria bacterium]|jgi:ornithine decarboxylase|nr:type III PLP-dependent enzyme [Xanthomonadales bacterium]